MKNRLLAILTAAGLCWTASANELPNTIQVTAGDLKIELGARFFWNLNGIWHQGKLVCQKNKGFYGTVLAFSGLGWVGTGHTDNKEKIGETEVKCEFLVDGKPWRATAEPLNCQSFEMKKTSLLHQVRAEYRLLLENNQILEEVKLTAEKDSSAGIGYHFMHPWEPMFTEYLLRNRDQQDKRSVFAGENENIAQIKPDWAAFYAPEGQFGLVTVVRDTTSPANENDEWLIWNRGRDRKLYYVIGKRLNWKAGYQTSAKAVTGFFTAPAEQWTAVAAAQAAALAGKL